MKKTALIVLAFPCLLAVAQAAPDPAAPPAAPGAETQPQAVPPAPAPEKPKDLGPFKTEQERRSYALGVFFANRAKTLLQMDGRKPKADEVVQGIVDILEDKKSKDYLAGMSLGAMIKQDDVPVDREAMIAALKEVLAGGVPKLDEEALRVEMQAVQQTAQQNRDAKLLVEKEKNLKESEAFLATNKGAKDVVALPSGLQYQVIQTSEGKKPEASELAVINYKGTLLNGEEFDKSPPTGHKMRLTGPSRIEGLREGIMQMTVGSKYKFWVAPALGLGDQPNPTVRPNSLLIYEVELVSIEAAPPPPPPATTPPVGVPNFPDQPGNPPGMPRKGTATAVTPPVSVEIPSPEKKDGDGNKEAPQPEEKSPEAAPK